MKKIITLLLFLVSSIASINATDFYSKVAAIDPNAAASWNTMANGSGTDAVVGDFTATGNKFIVQTGTTMVTTAAWAFGGTTTTLQIQTGGSLEATFAITFAAGNTFQIDNGGTFIQNVAMTMGSSIFAGTEAFGASSNYIVKINPTGTAAPSGAGYGNFTFNNTTQSANFGWAGTITTVQGNLTVISTGTLATNEQRLSSAAATITVGGNLDVQAGTLVLTTGTGIVTMSVAGTTTLSGSATLILAGSSGAVTLTSNGNFTQSGTSTLNLSSSSGIGAVSSKGDFTQSAGTITESGTNTTSGVSFTGTTLQNVTFSGTTANTINFGITNASGINLTGTMALNAASTLTITSTATDPIASASAGSVTYNATAILSYNGTGNQKITDKTWPTVSAPVLVVINNTGAAGSNVVTLATSAPRTMASGTFTLTSGVVELASQDLTFGTTSILSIASPNSAKMFATSGTAQLKVTMGATNFTFPVGDITGTVEYSECYIFFASKSASSTIGVKVTDADPPSNGSQTDFVSRYWSFTEDAATTYSYRMDFKGPDADRTGAYANMRMFRHNAGVWSQINSAAAGTTTYTVGNFTGTFPNQSEVTAPLGGNDFSGRTYLGATTYTWVGTTSDYQVASNWSPARNSTDGGDVLQFDGTGISTTVTNIPIETVSKLIISGASTQITFNSANALSINGSTATGSAEILNVAANCKLILGSSGNLSLGGSSGARTASVSGTLETASSGAFSIGFGSLCVLTFNNGSVFNYGSTATGGLSNGVGASAMVFLNGFTLNHFRTTGGPVLPSGTYNTGTSINIGTSVAPVTSLSFTPTTSFPCNVTMFVNLSTTTSISLSGASTFAGTWNITSTGAGRIRFSGSSTNTWTFNNQVTMTCTNATSGIELSSQTASSPSTWYTFGTASTTAPSLSITGGVLAQQTTTGTNAAFTTVAISNGLTIGNSGSIVANNNTGAVATGDFLININKGDLSFGTGTTMAGTTSSSTSTTSKLIIAFPAAATADQTFTPAVTTTGRTQISVAKTTSGNVNMSTRDLTTNAILLTGGKLVANALNVIIVPSGQTGLNTGVASGSKTANSWIVLTTGKLTVNLIGTVGKRFPVGVGTGANDYVGVQIYGASGTNSISGNNITVGVTAGITPATLTNAAQQIQITWDIARSNTGINIDADIYYDDAKAGGSCTPTANMFLSRYNGTNWGAALGTIISGAPISGATHGTDRVFSVTGLSATSPFTVGNATVLAAEFTNITAQAKGTMNIINFTTATEKDVKEFAIERSVNNRTWEVIGTLAAIGGTSATNYSFNDVNPTTLSYYRVRSVETNGKDQISKIVAVKRNGGKLAVNMVSPVPTTEGVNVDFSTSKIGTLNVIITDIVGKVVRTERFTTVEGANLMRLNLSNLAQGTYILSLNDGETVLTQRIVKQ